MTYREIILDFLPAEKPWNSSLVMHTTTKQSALMIPMKMWESEGIRWRFLIVNWWDNYRCLANLGIVPHKTVNEHGRFIITLHLYTINWFVKISRYSNSVINFFLVCINAFNHKYNTIHFNNDEGFQGSSASTRIILSGRWKDGVDRPIGSLIHWLRFVNHLWSKNDR